MLYVLTISLKGGRNEGLKASMGTAVGGLFHVFAAAVGISTLLMTSALAFSVVKYAGAAYLIYLGLRTLLSRDEAHIPDEKSQQSQALLQGIVTEMLNPKTALFFLAFIPQFVHTQLGHVFGQFIIFGVVSVVLNTSADVVVALLAGPIGQRLEASLCFRTGQRMTTRLMLVGLGAYAALGDKR
jgi:threonine/homoserine/homoserine lactone efflux protein